MAAVAALLLAFPATASAHENGWNTWEDFKAAHPLEVPEIDASKALTPASTEPFVEYWDDRRARWERWVEFDTAYWDELAKQRQEVVAEQVESQEVVAAPSSAAPLCDWSCIQCESGGNPQVVSPSGKYYGLYQYDYPSWVSDSGDPALYGNAPASYQHWVASHAPFDRWPNC